MSSNSSGENLLQNEEFVEKSYYNKLISDFKQLIFTIFFTLAKDQGSPSMILYLAILLLRFLQMLYFQFHQDVKYKKASF